MPLFTDDEMKVPLFIKIVKQPAGNPDGTHIEFFGRVSTAALNEIYPHMSETDRRFLEKEIHTAADLFESLQIIFQTWGEVHQGGQPAPNAVMHLYNPFTIRRGSAGLCQACGMELQSNTPFESDRTLFEAATYLKCIDGIDGIDKPKIEE